MRDGDIVRELGRLVDASDRIYHSDGEAAAMLGVGIAYFRKWYRPFCGQKEGNARTYRHSELLARREQVRREAD